MNNMVVAAGGLLLAWLPLFVGAAGSVAPFVVSDARDVNLMMEVAGVGPGDYLIDLGSGDGRIVVAAAQRGALAQGVELEPGLVLRGRARARAEGVAARTAFVEGDLFATDLSRATVVTLYLFPEANLRLRPRLLETLRPGTRVLSNSFDMGDWQADRHLPSASSGGLHLWIIPARVAGDWSLEFEDRRLSLAFTQRFQRIEGRLDMQPAAEGISLAEAALDGARIRFAVELDGEALWFTGVVDGDRMSGLLHRARDRYTEVLPWSAARLAPEQGASAGGP
jgi:hypothetical protein